MSDRSGPGHPRVRPPQTRSKSAGKRRADNGDGKGGRPAARALPAPLPIQEARQILLAHSLAPRRETVALSRVEGRILARGVRADRDIPPFDRAAVDGFAVRLDGPWRERNDFQVLGRVAAGERWRGAALRPGTAVAVMTGAPVPKSADGMVMVEQSEWLDATTVRLRGPFGVGGRPGIAPRGQDAARGDLVLAAGTRLEPSHVGILAGLGATSVSVNARPWTVSISTGDEVVAPTTRPRPWQIRNSNGPFLESLLRSSGLVASVRTRRARDTRASLRRALDLPPRAGGSRLPGPGVIVLTGGVSMGEFDLVPEVLEDVGFQIHVHRIAIKPGKPLLFGTRGTGARRMAVFGLPGNPVSVMVTAWEFLVPYLRQAQGCMQAALHPPEIRARALETVRRRPGLTHFVLAQSTRGSDGVWGVRPVSYHGSGDYLASSAADCLIVLSGDRPEVEAGALCEVHPLFREPFEIPGATPRVVPEED